MEAFSGRAGARPVLTCLGNGVEASGVIVCKWLLLRRSYIRRLKNNALTCLFAVVALSAARVENAHSAAAYAAMVVDGHTGKILYSRQGDAIRYPASLTKIMTLFLLFDQMEAGKFKGDSRLTVSRTASKQAPSKLGLKPGQTIRVHDAIRALVTKSANDVAVVIAENIGGTEANFAKLMTAKARAIGMKKTVFKNASGLPNKQQVTTARDMITLANRLMFDHPERYKYFSHKHFSYRGKKYRNHNRLLFDYKGTDGIKTGYIRASGFNLVANVRRGNKHLIAVVFGGKTSKRRNAAMRSILNKSLPKATAQLPRKYQKKKQYVVASASSKPLEFKTAVRAPAPVSEPPAQGSARGAASAKPVTAPPRPRIRDTGERPQRKGGGFHIQVGAYVNRNDALERLAAIQSKAGDVIKGYAPVTTALVEPKRSLYRARFAGFTRRTTAASTCSQLKRRAITCVVMSAE